MTVALFLFQTASFDELLGLSLHFPRGPFEIRCMRHFLELGLARMYIIPIAAYHTWQW